MERLPDDLTPRQISILVGTTLGDGCIAPKGFSHRVHIKHSMAQSDLALMKYEGFKPFVRMPPHRFDQKLNGRSYPCIQFATRSSPVFSPWHKAFYRNGRKVVPKNIQYLLDPLALAVWFMDDGAADHAGSSIQTHNFSEEEVELLQISLQERFSLPATMRRNRGRSILYFPKGSLNRLVEVIQPHLISTFTYKVPGFQASVSA